jgi:hypothetical protein
VRFYGDPAMAAAEARGRARGPVVEIGNAQGRIAVYLNETEAIDLAHLYGPSDRAYDELMDAVERAYPQPADGEEPPPGIAVVLKPDEHGRLRPGFRVT